jgi:hypothetical protein
MDLYPYLQGRDIRITEDGWLTDQWFGAFG